MKSFRWANILFLSFLILGCAKGGTYFIPIRYQPVKELPSLQQKIDSVLMIEIKRFWIEGKAAPFRTNTKTSVHFAIHLGVKKEGRVFTRNVEVEKDVTLTRLTPERVEGTVNQILTDIFDYFFSHRY